MTSILNHFFDLGFVNQSLDYLGQQLFLSVRVVDATGETVLGEQAKTGMAERFYPFAGEFGGLFCAAASVADLDRAEPHIRYCLAALNGQLERESELKETGEEMLQLASRQNFLHKLAAKILGIDDLSRCYRIILDEISQSIKADQAFIRTRGRWDETIVVTSRMTDEEMDSIRYEACVRDGYEAELGSSPAQAKPMPSGYKGPIICSRPDGSSLLISVIREKERNCGLMVFVRNSGHRPFSAAEKQFVGIIENIISPTFETLRLYDSLQDLYMNTVRALAAAIDAKDEYTHGHSFRVAKFAMAIGRQLGVADQELKDLEIAGYMHDLGKIGVSELILGKPGKLSHDEYDMVQKHPAFTDKILQPIKLPPRILEGAVQHHERMDGSGYPCGLKGSEISLFGRIIAVADVFDALTSKRPYRDGLPVEEALRILCDGIDTLFDREMVTAFIKALRSDSIGEVLNEMSMELLYDGIQNLNQFLIELTEFAQGERPAD